MIHGVVTEQEQFIRAADKLEQSQYALITQFYAMCERDKSKIPPTDVKLYEEFLSSTTSGRRSIKGSNVSRNLLDGASNAANFLLSPMRKASINSPKHKVREEELHNEKKQLEKQLQNKDLVIYDQQALLLEKDQKLKEKGNY